MSDIKRYPTRMHKIFGVEPLELAWFETKEENLPFVVDHNGFAIDMDGKVFSGEILCEMVNHPERIIRKPRLTEVQIKILKAALTLGFGWLAKDKSDLVFLYVEKPKKGDGVWRYNSQILRIYSEQIGCLVSWSDPEPLNLAEALKAAGVEV